MCVTWFLHGLPREAPFPSTTPVRGGGPGGASGCGLWTHWPLAGTSPSKELEVQQAKCQLETGIANLLGRSSAQGIKVPSFWIDLLCSPKSSLFHLLQNSESRSSLFGGVWVPSVLPSGLTWALD